MDQTAPENVIANTEAFVIKLLGLVTVRLDLLEQDVKHHALIIDLEKSEV